MDNRIYQIGIYALSLAGYVVLAWRGQATAEYVVLVGPVLGAAFLASHLKEQDQVLDKIHHNTNGVLTARIEQAVNNVLDARASGGDASDVGPGM